MKTSLDHLPQRKQQDVQTITTLLHNEFSTYLEGKSSVKANYRILKIILFGSHAKGSWVDDPANGYISDYDILLIVNDPALVEEYALWHAVEDRIQRSISTPVGLIIHTIEDINNHLHQGHYFFKDIREQGIELYSHSKKELAQPGNLTPQEQKAIAENHFQQWFESASDLLVTFRFDKDRGKLKQAAFLLHQATERFYGCTLLVCTNYRPKTHNIAQLRSLCAQQDSRYFDNLTSTTQFNRRSFQRLKQAYVDARYSEHYQITKEELNWLAQEVEKLQALTEMVCKEKIETLSTEGTMK